MNEKTTSSPHVSTGILRRFPVGAEPQDGGGSHVRVWAPTRQKVEVVVGDLPKPPAAAVARTALSPERDGYFSGSVRGLESGGRYWFRLDDEEKLYPDPASRFQPEGPHGPSEVVDPRRFAWGDAAWRGVAAKGQVIYELHVGTFTAEGTYASAAERLPILRDLGVTTIELMPLHEFPGRFGWGYDGVDVWAPTRLYGRPDDLRRFVDAAHRLGLAVILDVVYNHLGPDGNYLKSFSPHYFTDRYSNEWGEALNFDGEGSSAVREFFVENAGYWIEEFHFDGLRLDATQSIHDASGSHVLAQIQRRVREAARGRATYITAENEPQETRIVRGEDKGGYGIDSLWNDDFHHAAIVAITGRTEAYYTDYAGGPQELISAIRWGYLYQGQHYNWQKKRRGSPALDLAAENFVLYLENHDQVANSAHGSRLSLITAPARLRAMTALLLLAPGTPMLFQGQEFGSTRPFLYFADQHPELGVLIAKGRRKFLAQFPSLASREIEASLANPSSLATFESCKLDWTERERHSSTWALHRDLLALRRNEAAFRQQRVDRIHGSVLGPEALVVRYFCPGGDRLLVVNLGRDIHLLPTPEPLLAPPEGECWRVLWSSETPAYGGSGTPEVETSAGFHIPGHAAVVLEPGASPPT